MNKNEIRAYNMWLGGKEKKKKTLNSTFQSVNDQGLQSTVLCSYTSQQTQITSLCMH